MYQYLLMTGLYSLGMFLALLFMPFIRNTPLDEEYGIQLDQMYDRLFVEFALGDQLEEAPDSSLTEEELLALRDKWLDYEIPFVKLKVKMFYDHEKKSFGYYASSSIIHKYLNVSARKYVIEYGCKQIYKETVPCVQRIETDVMYGPFVTKPSKSFMEKEINQFHYLGNQYEIQEAKVNPIKKVSFADYLRLQAAKEADSSCNPDTQSTKLD
jgi:hypothetical protein